MTATPHHPSPPWGGNIKLLVGMTLVAIVGALLVRFQSFIGPMLLAFILVYLLRPLVVRLSSATGLSWRMSVNVIFVVLVALTLGLVTVTGVAVVQQLQSLINVVQGFMSELPSLVLEWSQQVVYIGTLEVDLSQYFSATDLEPIVQQVLGVVQPVLGRAGSLLSAVASKTISFLAWGFFIILVSYFVLADMGRIPDQLVRVEIPGYDADIRRLGRELSRIWNAFLRGQVLLFTLTVLTYILILSVLGIRYFLGLALLAGLARFVPYVGSWVTWITTILVAMFQKSNYFGLDPWQYALLVVGIAILVDQIFDNVVSPRVMGQTLGVHPAAVLIAALVAANLMGLVGIVLAAPVLASFLLIGRYVARKMLDLDPWPEPEKDEEPVFQEQWVKWKGHLEKWARTVRRWLRRR